MGVHWLKLISFECSWRVDLVVAPGDIVLLVGDVLASSEPPSAIFFKLSFGPNAWPHTVLIQAGSLGQIQKVELDPLGLLVCMNGDVLVQYFEVVPLGIAFRVDVVLQPQVVFNIGHLGRLS